MNGIEYFDYLTKEQQAIYIVAYASLNENNEPVFPENIESEANRIERCIEYHYQYTKHDLHYAEFISKFLTDNYHDIVYNDTFLDFYIDDVPEIKIEECEDDDF